VKFEKTEFISPNIAKNWEYCNHSVSLWIQAVSIVREIGKYSAMAPDPAQQRRTPSREPMREQRFHGMQSDATSRRFTMRG
jgi:hypothetical protein